MLYIYLAVLSGVILYFKQSRAIIIMILVFFMLVMFLDSLRKLIFHYEETSDKMRFNYLNSYLIRFGDPDKYLEEVEIDLRSIQGKLKKNILLINKSGCLSALGRFEDALDTLYLVNKKYLTQEMKVGYHNAILYNYLFSKDYFMAQRIYKENYEYFVVNDKYDLNVNLIIEGSLGMLEFYEGNLSESKKQFENILSKTKQKGLRILPLYFLGLIYLKENRTDEAIDKLKECIRLTKKSFFYYEATKILEKISN